jgi:hypothetical protein
MATKIEIVGKYAWNVAVALDQLANTILGGDPDETICSHAAKRMHSSRFWGAFAAVMEFLDPGHMERSAEHDRGKDSISEFIARKRRERAERDAERRSAEALDRCLFRMWQRSMFS